MGCSNRIVKWFERYLSERIQRVVTNGQSSYWVHILAGVPPGSILDPLLFLIYISDIVQKHWMFPTSLNIVVDWPLQSAQLLNTDLQTIANWAAAWLVIFNPHKHCQC